jgi:hypothetical protein
MVKNMAAAAAAGLIGGALILAGTAHAGHAPPVLNVGGPGECGTVAFQADLPAEPHGSYQNARLVVDDGIDVHVAELGVKVEVGSFDTPTATIHYRVFGGGERDYDVPLWDGYEPGPGAWRNSINDYGAEHGWEWVHAGASDENPFVTWHTVEVEGCPPEPAPISASHQLADCGKATITFTNTTAHTYDADIRVGDQAGTPDAEMPDPHNHGVTPDQTIAGGPHAGEPFGLRYDPVLLPPGESVTKTIDLDEDTTVSYRVWRGPENDYYLPWVDVNVTACPVDETGKTDGTETTTVTHDKLPVTGASLPMLIGAGLLLLVGGGAAMALERRRGLV